MVTSRYVYSALNNDENIRLLRLSPSPDFSDRIEGHLFEYTLSISDKTTHLYEALSYTWGKPDRKYSIWIQGDELPITANCHAALAQLRDDFLDRIIWIDAICIDQDNKDERGIQVQHMADIYCKASQVIVWLGEATSKTDGALEIIRTAAEGSETWPIPESQSVINLLQRPWFRRIWVLQEVAAARHVVVACGATQIDGYAFCLGLPPHIYDDSASAAVRSIEFLIRRSIFRPKYTRNASGRVALGIRPLGELMDMYHSHEATEPLDRVFALLGMSTDGFSAAGLVPNYNTPWHVLFERLINFVLGPRVSVKTFVDRTIAMICGQGTVIGKVTSVSNSIQNRHPQATITYAEEYQSLGSTSVWTFHPSVRGLVCGDVVCWLDGASRPMVIRPLKTHSSVIMVSVTPPQGILDLGHMSTLLKFVLVWNLEASGRNAQDAEIEDWLDDKVLVFAQKHPQKQLREGDLSQRVAQVLAAAGQYEHAAKLFHDASESYRNLKGEDDLCTIRCLADLAVTRENLKQWTEAKDLWTCITRASCAMRLGIPDILAFLSKLLVTLKHVGHKNEESKWRATRRILQSKQDQVPLTVEMVFDITTNHDSEMVGILLDHCADQICVDQWMLIAAAGNVTNGASVMELLLNRSKAEPEITEAILTTAAGNHLSGERLVAMLLERGGKEVKITQDVLKSAAGNSHCSRDVVRLLLAHQGKSVGVDFVTEVAWEELASFLAAGYAVNSEATEFEQITSLLKSFSMLQDNIILRIILSSTDPAILSRRSRELLQFTCDNLPFHHFRLLVHMGRPRLTDIIHALAYALLWHDEILSSKLLEVTPCRYNDTDDPVMVAEEVVNGCSRIIETGTPAELSLFLDALNQLGISSKTDVWLFTQSSILPAVVADDHSFLMILIKWALVDVRMVPFSLIKMNWKYYEWAPDLGEKICEMPPQGMPDWPLYCAILFVHDVAILRNLCRAGTRLNCSSSEVNDQQEPPIIATLREQGTLEVPRAKFAEAMSNLISVADAATSMMEIESENLLRGWQYAYFPQAWISMRNILQRKIFLHSTLHHNSSAMLEDLVLHTWPEPLSNEKSWKRWRDEAITVLSNEYSNETSN